VSDTAVFVLKRDTLNSNQPTKQPIDHFSSNLFLFSLQLTVTGMQTEKKLHFN